MIRGSGYVLNTYDPSHAQGPATGVLLNRTNTNRPEAIAVMPYF